MKGQTSRHYAHTAPGDQETWEPLKDHLEKVAATAAEFASGFGAFDWGRMAGLWHDLGKYSAEFQAYLRKNHDPDSSEESLGGGRVDHSTFGAQYAAKVLSPHVGQMMAFCIAGHHAGLADGVALEGASQTSSLKMRLLAGPPRVPRVQLPADMPATPKLRLPFVPDRSNAAFQGAFFTRMLFSCLVDADRIATEAFCDPAQSAERTRPKPTMVSLRDTLARALQSKLAEARLKTD